MCRQVSCKICSKPTWQGCGLHIEQALKNVPIEERCNGWAIGKCLAKNMASSPNANTSAKRKRLQKEFDQLLQGLSDKKGKKEETTSEMKIGILSALNDNYMYLIIDPTTKKAACVDPFDVDKVKAAVKKEGVELESCLTTHSHWDHNGGNTKLAAAFKNITIYAGYTDKITQKVKHGDLIKIGNLTVRALSTPCHTPDHVCYYIDSKDGNPGAVFTGDTMFIGGCGNFNNGTPEQMYKNMVKTLGELPGKTLVYVGHEYTVRNLEFALFVEPNNKDIRCKLDWAKNQRIKKLPTAPSTIEEEWKTNPFMRGHEAVVQKFTSTKDPVKTIFAVRKMKDVWGRTH